jgi:hypothetical protein
MNGIASMSSKSRSQDQNSLINGEGWPRWFFQRGLFASRGPIWKPKQAIRAHLPISI